MAQTRVLVESTKGTFMLESDLTRELHRSIRGYTRQSPIRAQKIEFTGHWGGGTLQVQDGTPREQIEAALKTVLDQLYAEPPAEPT